MESEERRTALRGLVSRIDLDDFAGRVLESYWTRSDVPGVRPPRRRAYEWARWNLDLVLRWLIDGIEPTEADLDAFRVRARARVLDGTAADFVPGNFRQGARFGWNAALEIADERERAAVLESADLLFEFVDRVSRIYAEAYEVAAGSGPGDAEERVARALLRCLCVGGPGSAEEVELAAELGFTITEAFRPFVIALPRTGTQPSGGLARRLRRAGRLAVTEDHLTVGLGHQEMVLRELGLPPAAAVVAGDLTVREAVGEALEELRMVALIAVRRGHAGRLRAQRYLPELLLGTSPRIASEIRERVYAPLGAYPELSRTLDVLVEHNFNRQAAAAALPVHRNTLRDRLARVSELAGIDLDCADHRGLVWLARLSHFTGQPDPAP